LDVVREACRAKLNLFLDVVGRRDDGFHDLVTVFHEIDFADDLQARLIPDAFCGVTIRVVGAPGMDMTGVPTDPSNLARRGARAVLRDADSEKAIALELTKRVPAGAGLGGGSADAAAALRAANKLIGSPRTDADLERLGLALGSDVPFLVRGGTALGRGRGEVLERIEGVAPTRFALLHPDFETSTAAVYAQVTPPYGSGRTPDDVLAALRAGDAEKLAASCFNALEAPARRAEPRMAEALDAARAVYGPLVHLTGSGSTMFVVAPAADFEGRFADLEARCALFRGFTRC
jgi:4-diphosphocytidyl-2-C-methyl-D-erythritol kinase